VGFERSDSAVALLGMEGFVLLAAAEVDGELHQLVETQAAVVGCAGCGTRALSKGRRRTKVRDLPSGGRPVVVVWAKRIWRCPDADCDVKTWSEASPLIDPRASMTERARAEACRRVGQDNHAVAQVGRSLGVGWAAVMAAVRDYGRPLVEDPGRIGAVGGLGLDETAFLRANARRHTVFVTGFVDIIAGPAARHRGRSQRQGGETWLAGRSESWLAGAHPVAIDPHRGYANGVAEKLAHATLVIDPFHALRLANVAIDDVRRRDQNDTLGHRGRKGEPALRHPPAAAAGQRAPGRVAHGFRDLDNYRLRLLLHCGVKWQLLRDEIRGRSTRLVAYTSSRCRCAVAPLACRKLQVTTWRRCHVRWQAQRTYSTPFQRMSRRYLSIQRRFRVTANGSRTSVLALRTCGARPGAPVPNQQTGLTPDCTSIIASWAHEPFDSPATRSSWNALRAASSESNVPTRSPSPPSGGRCATPANRRKQGASVLLSLRRTCGAVPVWG